MTFSKDTFPELDAAYGATPVAGGSGGTGLILVFDGLPGHLYTVRHGTDLGQITQEIASIRTTTAHDAEILEVPVTLSGQRGF